MHGSRVFALLRRRSVAAGCGFFLAGAGIAANALFLQPGRHPAPFVATRADLETTEAAQPNPLVRAIQEELARAGFYEGAIDGVPGPQTRDAVLAFEKAAGHAATGVASEDLLAALRRDGREPTAPQIAAPEPAPVVAPFDERVAAVQSALARAAYGPLGADGRVGPRTRQAIERFQSDHGLAVTGEVSDALIVELRSVGALEEI